MTREAFIRKYLGNKRYEYNNADIDLMREDLDKVIDYHALRQPDVIKSVCEHKMEDLTACDDVYAKCKCGKTIMGYK